MDWKQLVQFALLGSGNLEQYAVLLVRVSLGLFFGISGANKLFVAGGTKPIYETLVAAKVPFPRQTAYFVSGVEFVCGSCSLSGCSAPVRESSVPITGWLASYCNDDFCEEARQPLRLFTHLYNSCPADNSFVSRPRCGLRLWFPSPPISGFPRRPHRSSVARV
jgi:DoxX